MRLIACLAICLLQIFACTGETGNVIVYTKDFDFTLNSEESISVKDGILRITGIVEMFNDAMYDTLTFKLFLDGATSGAPVLENTIDKNLDDIDITFNVSVYAPYLSQQRNDPSNIIVNATLKEKNSNVQVTASLSVAIYPFSYNITCMLHQCCTFFEPYTLRNVDLQITHVQYGKPCDKTSIVELNYLEVLRKQEGKDVSPQTSGNRNITFSSTINEACLVQFHVLLPALEEYEGYYHYYDMQLKYQDEIQKIGVTDHNK